MSRINATLPIDGNNKQIQNADLVGAVLAETYDATISSATSITLNASTTSFEVLAITTPILLKFAAGVSTSDFDAVIAANQTKVFYRDPSVTVISVIEAAATGAVAIVEK